MTAWTSDELDTIAAADELQIAPLRRDGTLRTPVPIWVVRHGNDLYVRSYRGRSGSWFRGSQVRHEGHIRSGGVDKDVTFAEETDPAVNDQVDAEYRAKYRRYSGTHVDPWWPPQRGPRRSSSSRAETVSLPGSRLAFCRVLPTCRWRRPLIRSSPPCLLLGAAPSRGASPGLAPPVPAGDAGQP